MKHIVLFVVVTVFVRLSKVDVDTHEFICNYPHMPQSAKTADRHFLFHSGLQLTINCKYSF